MLKKRKRRYLAQMKEKERACLMQEITLAWLLYGLLYT